MSAITRRSLLRRAAVVAAMPWSRPAPAGFAAPAAAPTLGFSLYGMKDLTLDEALEECAAVGYDDVEFSLMSDFHADPVTLSAERRREIRKRLGSLGLRLPALMDSLGTVGSDESHHKNLDRLKRAAGLAHDLAPERPPILETILGGKPAEWPQIREKMLDRLRDWAETARKHELVVAVKPHVSQALHLPDDAAALVAAVDSPHIRLTYDYSHYEAQGLPLDETLSKLIDRTVFIHVKDGEREDGQVKFLLPGEGRTDYAAYFRRLIEFGYSGSVTVEVSSRIFKQPSYDPRAAAKQSYRALAKAWDDAGLPKRRKPA